VWLGLTEGGADAQNGALALRIDSQGDQDGAIDQAATLADFLIPGVQDQIGERSQGSRPPGLEFDVELGGALADLSGTDRTATKLFDDRGDLAGRNALNIHLGQGQLEGLLAANALLEGRGIELQSRTDLGHPEGDVAHAGGEGLGLETIGQALAAIGALVGLGLQDGGALAAHGFIDEQADAFGEALMALFGEELQDGVQEFRVGGVGHAGSEVGCVC
jgi:hypothetical protein